MKEKEMKRVPKLRFPEFTDDWEQRKLGELYGTIGNAFVGTATPYYVEIGHFYLESNNVKDGQINHNSEIFINDEFYEKQKDKWLHTGDMVMVQSGHVGHAAVIPKELDNTAAHALIMFRNKKEKIEPYFLNYEYQTEKAKKKIENITTGNTIKHILASDMREFEVDVPKYEEQKVIAGYFRKLDNLITLHQRKLEKLKELRKGVMKKLFNQEVRFKADDESEFPEWEKKKIGDVFSQIKYKNKDGRNQNVITNSAEFGLINQRDFFDKDIAVDGKTENYTVIKTGDFVYNPRKSKQAPYGPFNCYKLEENGIVSPLYTCLRPKSNVNDKYLLWYFKSGSWHRFIYENGAQNGARHDRVGMTDSLMQEIPVYLPQAVEEQQKIADCLLSLDDVIAKQKATLVAWEELKKGLLQQMFV